MTMATQTLKPRLCFQPAKFTKQDGWLMWNVFISSSGKIALSGCNMDTKRTSIEVYSVGNFDCGDVPKKIYSNEFERYVTFFGLHTMFLRLVSLIDDNILTCIGDKLELISMGKDEVLKSRKIDGESVSWSVRESEVFISFVLSNANKISVFDMRDLHEIRSIKLEGIHDDYRPKSIAAIADRIFICESKQYGGRNERVLVFDQTDGAIMYELAKPTDSHWYIGHVTVCEMLDIVVATWSNCRRHVPNDRYRIMFYSLLSETKFSFLTVETESIISSIKISDKGDKLIVKNHLTRDLRVYDMAEVFTYSNFKANLSSRLQREDCLKLTSFFALNREQIDDIIEGNTPAENLLAALEEKGCIEPSNVDRLTEAFHLFNVNSSCINLVDLYRKTRMKKTVGSMVSTNVNAISGIWRITTAEPRSIDPDRGNKDQGSKGSQKTAMWSVQTKISNDGGFLGIESTDITLAIPPNALGNDMSECLIRMTVIHPGDFNDDSFSSNSSFNVELLPKNLKFQEPVELTLPHCLELKADVDLKAKILTSHHEGDAGLKWEEDTDQRYILDDKTCTIWLKRCGWFKYEIDDEIVKAKRIQIYAAAKPICVPGDISEIAVGYHLDLPGAGEILQLNSNFIIGQRRPFLFRREGNYPLTVSLLKILSHTWRYSTPEENPKELPFRRVASAVECSCQFILEQNEKTSNIPTCVLKVSQNSDGVRLNIRPKVKENVLGNVKLDESKIEDSREPQSYSYRESDGAVRPKILEKGRERGKKNVTASDTPSLNPLNSFETQQQVSTHRDYQMFPHRRVTKGPMKPERITRLLNDLPKMANEMKISPPILVAMKELLHVEGDAQLGITSRRRELGASLQVVMKDYNELLGPKPAFYKHPEYSNESHRVKSYEFWPEFCCQQPRELAEAGFFKLMGDEDNVRCFYCGVTIRHWEPGDEPWEQHARQSAGCQWLKRQKGQRFIDGVTKKYSNSEHSPEGDVISLQYCITHASAKNPKFCDESARLETFTDWPSNRRPTPEILTQAGFFTRGTGDHVECFYCGLNLSHWEQQYEPWEEHARHNPRCQWLLEQKGQLFIDDVTKKYHPRQDSHDVHQAMKDDYGYLTDEDQFIKIFAQYPTYCLLGRRRDSFSNWHINNLQQLDEWTQAGFFCYVNHPKSKLLPIKRSKLYTSNGDQVKCFYCAKTVVNWTTETEPWEKHARLSSQCKWLLRQKGEHFVEKVKKENKLKPLESEMQKLLPLTTGARSDIFVENKKLAIRVIDEAIENLTQVKTKYSLIDEDGYLKDEDQSMKNIAKHPEYFSEVSRRDSFSNWPSERLQELDKWIPSGFFSNGNEHQITCFCCGGTLDKWMADDEPWEKHALLSPDCFWLLKQKGKHFVDEVGKKRGVQKTSSRPATEVRDDLVEEKKVSVNSMIEEATQHLGDVRVNIGLTDEDGYSTDKDHVIKSLARYPSYSFEDGRRVSFSNWHVEKIQQLDTWIKAGFFCHSNGKRVTCFCCGVTFDKWIANDEPWEKHALLSPDCVWLLEQKGKDYVSDLKEKYTAKQNLHKAETTTRRGILKNNELPVNSGIEEDLKIPEQVSVNNALKDENKTSTDEEYMMERLAQYPKYCSEGSRRGSFSKCSVDKLQHLDIWTQAGFFSNESGDQVTCFCCGKTLVNWKGGDEPWKEHARLSPGCKWLLRQRGKHFVNEVEKKCASIVTRPMNFPFVDLLYAIIQNWLPPVIANTREIVDKRRSLVNRVIEDSIEDLRQLKIKYNALKDEDGYPADEDHLMKSCAKYPYYCSESSRRNSFLKWPVEKLQQLDRWIQAGFFGDGKGDQLTCFCCGETLDKWMADDEPWEKHALLSPGCKWLLEQKGEHFVDEVERKHAVKPRSPLPVTEADVNLHENKCVTNKVMEEIINILKQITLHRASKKPEELIKSREKPVCEVCFDNDLAVAFHPCQHKATCKSCADKRETCPICLTPIVEKIPVTIL